MKSLDRAIADYEKAKEKMEASKARYEADLKKFKIAEAAKTESENMEIVRIIRGMDIDISDLANIKTVISAGMPYQTESKKEETSYDGEENNE